ncbi:MAG: molybdenum cofactor guanylyltransferase [Caldiserica bacterium]|jgi:molybdopterin-guanine dinucleotide biosynthesis protein A|nr:molybdenum cofactor guanylyltransferase [Caldisericota bacterium]
MENLDSISQRVSTIILAGGQGKRLGRSKATLPFLGKPLLEWVIKRVELLSYEILVISDDQTLPMHHPKTRIIPDIFPARGPLGGLYTGISSSKTQLAFAFGCDMPFLNRTLLLHMVEIVPGFDAVVPRLKGKVQPLHALYSRECLPAFKSDLEKNLLKLTLALSNLHVRYLEEEEIINFDPQMISFFNINSPSDLKRALLLGREGAILDHNELY